MTHVYSVIYRLPSCEILVTLHNEAQSQSDILAGAMLTAPAGMPDVSELSCMRHSDELGPRRSVHARHRWR